MGIPLGHKLKIIKKIKDMRAEKGLGAIPIQYSEGMSSKPVSNNQYEELPGPDGEEKQPISKPKGP